MKSSMKSKGTNVQNVLRILVGGVIAVIAISAIAAFVLLRPDAPTAGAVSAAADTTDTTTVQQGNLLITLNASGSLQAIQNAALSFTVSGKVASIAVDKGDHVLKGQLLATLDNTSATTAVLLAQAKIDAIQVVLHRLTDKPRQVDVNVAKTALNLAQAQLKAAQGSVDHIQAQIANLAAANAKNALWLQELTRDADKKLKDSLIGNAQTKTQGYAMPSDAAENTQLTQKGFDVQIAQANADAANSQTGNVSAITGAEAQVTAAQNALSKLLEGGDTQDVQRTQINLKAAQVALDQAKAALDKTKLLAPFDGVVGAMNLNLGEQAPAGAAVVLLDTSSFYVDLPIAEVNISKVAVGQEADLSFDAFPGTLLKGKVTRIGTSQQKSAGVVTYAVRVELNPDGEPLLSSMTTVANIVIGQASNVLLLPNRYVRVDGATGKAYARLRQTDGSFQDTEIVLGLQNETVTEIKSGLHAGDVVALP